MGIDSWDNTRSLLAVEMVWAVNLCIKVQRSLVKRIENSTNTRLKCTT